MMVEFAGISFPNEARLLFEEWRAKGENVIVQTMTGDIPTAVKCANCNDMGSIFLRLLRGRFVNPPGAVRRPITFFEGVWHVIDDVRGFVCPVCSGRGMVKYAYQPDLPEPTMQPGPARDAIEETAEQLDQTGDKKWPYDY